MLIRFRVTGLYCLDCVHTFCGSFFGFVFDANLVPCVEGDVDADGDLDFDDLLGLLSAWGACEAPPEAVPLSARLRTKF